MLLTLEPAPDASKPATGALEPIFVAVDAIVGIQFPGLREPNISYVTLCNGDVIPVADGQRVALEWLRGR